MSFYYRGNIVRLNKYTVEMLAVDEAGNIIMGEYSTREEAEARLKECEEKDIFHYFEVFENKEEK